MATHRIHRVEIEIEVGPVEHGRALIERLSQLQPRRIAPLIDRVCTELSGPERHDRIDTLELDLGPISLDQFDDDFIRALEVALRSALARQLDRQMIGERPETAALELLDGFARTGNLPWWADRDREGLIAEQIRIALDSAPERWLGLLHALAEDQTALSRLATHCDRPQIEAIGTRVGLGHEHIAKLHGLERWIADSRVFSSTRVAELRVRSAWLAALGRGRVAAGSVSLPEVIVELIGLAPIVLGPLRRTIGPSTTDAPRSATPAWLLAAIASVFGGVEHPPEHEHQHEHDDDAASDANAAIASVRESTDLESEIVESEPPSESDIHEHDSASASARDIRDSASTTASPAPPEDSENPTTASSEEPLDTAESPIVDPRARPPSSDRPIDPPAHRAARRRALERLETLYVDDAGLVILWPFLDRFFLRAGLLDLDRRFIDEQATMQAIALLSQLAVEDPEPAEFRLPLAKLLCGRSPEDAFVLERPLVPEQIDECERLLASVIHNAPILRDTSIASFRANFVQRPAALSISDGGWLLEVEERPHDLMLERFPWSWGWVKLAWMADPLSVRW